MRLDQKCVDLMRLGIVGMATCDVPRREVHCVIGRVQDIVDPVCVLSISLLPEIGLAGHWYDEALPVSTHGHHLLWVPWLLGLCTIDEWLC